MITRRLLQLLEKLLDQLELLHSSYRLSLIHIYNYSDIRVAKGDFIRLKSLSVGYTIPQKLFKSWKLFSDIRLRVTGKMCIRDRNRGCA